MDFALSNHQACGGGTFGLVGRTDPSWAGSDRRCHFASSFTAPRVIVFPSYCLNSGRPSRAAEIPKAGLCFSQVSASLLVDDALLQECNSTDILLAVKESPSTDGRYLRLGSCGPSRGITVPGYVVFAGPLKACGFSQLTAGAMVEFFADLVYSPPPQLSAQPYLGAFSHQVNCTYAGLEAPAPSQVSSVTGSLSGIGHLDFSVRLWPGDLGTPTAKVTANSTTVSLGSGLQVEFSVASDSQQPLQLYVDTCVAYPGPALSQPSLHYNIIDNHGCFVDGWEASSRFLPRSAPETLLLSLQAFQFTELDSDVYLHCHLLVWDPKVPSDNMKKACSFHRETNEWVLLDDPLMSSVCHCCESRCLPNQHLHRRDLAGSGEPPEVSGVQVNPLVIKEDSSPVSAPLLPLKDKHNKGGPLDLLPLILGSLLLEVMLLTILATAFCVHTSIQPGSQTWARSVSPTGSSVSSIPQNA
ncbi:zona pellucida sperm-binding protein 3-like [Dromiciops gliroides]|uniref:zona pellucida sperm-binding protein 3-like n=1 Tax=Dromiciops gliroides TaxID=33562 RepID=UPI001CC359AA|nr:zona pellucida sperm-binding protein 3-like [Dromiciops gliroides]